MIQPGRATYNTLSGNSKCDILDLSGVIQAEGRATSIRQALGEIRTGPFLVPCRRTYHG